MPGRIPDSLKNVFLASQTGIDVNTINAPNNGVGFKVFQTKKTTQYHHSVIAHQQIPKPPKQSSLNRIRRADSANSLSDISVNSRSSNNSSSASLATKREITDKGTRGKRVDAGSPQHFLNKELKKRGYSLKSYATLESGYYCHPNKHQLSSYGRIVTKAMYQPNNTGILGKLLEAGISPNACNKFGESIVHLVCRRGHMALLTMLLDSGGSIKVSDDYGRTPLHDACWQSRPNFDVIRLILETDKYLVRMRDIRGTTPLTYVKKENYMKWNEFLASIMDEFWPVRKPEDGPEKPPPLTLKKPNSMPLREPTLPLSMPEIEMVATGALDVEEALYMASMNDDESDDSSYFDSDDSSFFSDSGSDSEFDEAELDDLCVLTGSNFRNMKEFCVRG